MKVKISEIKIGNRFRKDLGEIHTLADSIKEIGLLQPPVINENKELIAGARRIEACKLLGWDEIAVTIVNLNDIIKGEFHENVVRKDFTMSERVAILEEVERQRIGHRPGKGGKLPPFQKENKGKKSRDIVSEYTGVSPRQLQKEKKIVEAARENPELRDKSRANDKPGFTIKEILDKVDNNKMSVDKAYKTLSKIQIRNDMLKESERHAKGI
jgi:ParB family chromosome partitioning protein